MTFSIGNAITFSGVTRGHFMVAAQALGLVEKTAIRELDRMLVAMPTRADKLIADIEGASDSAIAASPDPDAARLFLAGELRVLRAIRYIVLADMCRQLAPG